MKDKEEMKVNLMDFTKSIYSQHGQDGVLEEIYKRIGTTNKFFVEFGSSGRQDSQGNTAYLRTQGFDGLLMDGYEAPYSEKVERDYPVQIEFITPENINTLFEKYNVPHEFDLLSIDIDGQDFHVWNSIDQKYKPRVVVIESNYYMFPKVDKVQPYDVRWVWDGTHRYGSSIRALMNLGIKKGYSLVAYTGADGIFVRTDILTEKRIDFQFTNNDEALWYMNFQQGTLPKEEHVQINFEDTEFFKPSSFYLK